MSPALRGVVGGLLLVLLLAASVGHRVLMGDAPTPGCSPTLTTTTPGAGRCLQPFDDPASDGRSAWQQATSTCLCDRTLPGYSVWSRALSGLWRSAFVGVVAATGVLVLALGLALLARRVGGVVELFLEKSADLFFAVPDVLLLIALRFVIDLWAAAQPALMPVLGQPLLVVTLSLIAVGWAAPAGMIHRRLQSLQSRDFVAAAVALGASRGHVLWRHIVPFAWTYVVALYLLRVPAMVLAETTISYLGFGLQPTTEASIGSYAAQTAAAAFAAGRLDHVLPPVVLLVALVAGFQLVGAWVMARAGGDDG